ncbi:MAG: hypothetical protein QF486_02360 [Candidatus Woesearchaeota archaeon]|nr:hypothetical protein [Candidatus Woesearchaeota archaeon]MDP7181395.1 hypothetical protein [Candidatus Woesearchaeota archaeon]MDP7198437.1 hypothetical protein [Candidatus Woesearchaeota archaeon]MDP7466821.1 hypothetical protein [Candidatus Woesearchaeota archaeon]MDP7648046.1 hypothetical protein [Candidatus Woesearchaeota archaeon]
MWRDLYSTAIALVVTALVGCKGPSTLETSVTPPKPNTPATLAQSVLDFKGPKNVETFPNRTEHTIPESPDAKFTFTAMHTQGGPITYKDMTPEGWSPGDSIRYSAHHVLGRGDTSRFMKYMDECRADGTTRTKASDPNYGMWFSLSVRADDGELKFPHVVQHGRDARAFNQAILDQPLVQQ